MEGEEEIITRINVTPEKILKIKNEILNDQLPMERRNRSLFTLRSITTQESIDALVECLNSSTCSALLKHEIAYVLGQMKNPYAVPFLSQVLANEKEDVIVRHEAGEALGAIGNADALEVLNQFVKSPITEIAETCQIAIDRIKYFDNKKKNNPPKKSDKDHGDEDEEDEPEQDEEEVSTLYFSVDPAPSLPLTVEDGKTLTIDDLRDIMMNTTLPLFERYRAMFALRDIGTAEAVHAMAAGFADSSALFRHEVAFVMGQLQNPASAECLAKVLENGSEHSMVRHEAAEALGSIATEETLPLLEKFLKDDHDVVRESCSVALDIHSYVNSDQFQYADGLTK